jgi:hypothetical protein
MLEVNARGHCEVTARGQCERSMREVNARGQCERSMREVNARGPCERSMREVNARGQYEFGVVLAGRTSTLRQWSRSLRTPNLCVLDLCSIPRGSTTCRQCSLDTGQHNRNMTKSKCQVEVEKRCLFVMLQSAIRDPIRGDSISVAIQCFELFVIEQRA